MNILDWDLDVVRIDFISLTIGFGVSLGTPLVKKYYVDNKLYRAIHIQVFLMGFNLSITIPLWVDAEEQERL